MGRCCGNSDSGVPSTSSGPGWSASALALPGPTAAASMGRCCG